MTARIVVARRAGIEVSAFGAHQEHGWDRTSAQGWMKAVIVVWQKRQVLRDN
jgi:hypothetical protein